MKTLQEIYNNHKSPTSRLKPETQQSLFEKQREDKNKKKSKYLNKWVVIDSIKFQSEGEGYYYLELKSRLLRGEFKEFKRQLPIEFEVNGVRVGKYIADFAVLHYNGSIEIIDYKSRFTATLALYGIKKQLMLALYGVEIKEVGKK